MVVRVLETKMNHRDHRGSAGKLLILAIVAAIIVQQLKVDLLLPPTATVFWDALAIHQSQNQSSEESAVEASRTPAVSTFLPDANGYYRMDQVGPKVIYAKTHYFQSLPTAEYRFPRVPLSNLTNYFEMQRFRTQKFYWEYNPSLVPLPSNQVPIFLNASEPFYLGVYRISNQQGCFTMDQTKPSGKEQVNLGTAGPVDLMGFAILNATSLDIVAETIVNAGGRDYRLFRNGDHIYLTRDTGFWEVWLHETPTNQERDRTEMLPFVRNEKNGFPIYKGHRNYCCTSHLCKGKNFNYFVDSHGKLMVDSRSMGPHIVEGVDLVKKGSCHVKTFQPPMTEHNYTLTSSNTTNFPLYVTRGVPPESFHTTDEPYFAKHKVKKLPYSEERGTACCIRIPNQLKNATISSDCLLVGVSHTKITKWEDELMRTHNVSFTLRQYNSRFYAFEPIPPYRVLAQSGRFCMPYPPATATNGEEEESNPNMPFIRNIPLVVGHDHTCPYITFVMGMIESIDDPNNTVIMSYGMNDCGAQIAKVPKSEISRMLFP